MGFLLVLLGFVAIVALVNILALLEGRSGSTLTHKAMFACGGIGLLSLFVVVGSAFLLGAMLVVATLNSPQGYAFKVSASVCAASTFVALFLYIAVTRR
jgi:hypothetical protein